MRIDLRGDDEDGWFLDAVEHGRTPHVAFFTGPFRSRAEAARALPEYRRAIERTLPTRPDGAG